MFNVYTYSSRMDGSGMFWVYTEGRLVCETRANPSDFRPPFRTNEGRVPLAVLSSAENSPPTPGCLRALGTKKHRYKHCIPRNIILTSVSWKKVIIQSLMAL